MTAQNHGEQRDEDGRILVDDPSDIPAFRSDEEELEYWRTHTPSERFFAEAEVTTLEEFLRRETQANRPR